MTGKKNEAGTLLPITVMEGLAVNILPSEQYEFLMTTKEVSHGYGATEYAIRMSKTRHDDELKEGKHYVVGVTICYGVDIPHNRML